MHRWRLFSTMLLAGLLFCLGGLEVHAQPPASQPRDDCDPVVSGLASLVVPGWGQSLNGDPQRKSITHFTVGLVSTLAMIYRWTHKDGRIFRTVRIVWGFLSGMEAYGTCSAKQPSSSS